MEFYIGDRVVCIKSGAMASAHHVGKIGTVRCFDGADVGVEFDDIPIDEDGSILGHRLGNVIATNAGWFCRKNELERVQPEIACPVEDLL